MYLRPDDCYMFGGKVVGKIIGGRAEGHGLVSLLYLKLFYLKIRGH